MGREHSREISWCGKNAFDPTSLSKYGRLAMVARQLVEGFLTGAHKSPYKGFSVEFAEHRQYYPGDEIRHIDWRAFGKTDRYFIKEYEEETNLKAHLLVDASGSMAYKGAHPSKFEYAQYIAASLAYLMLHQRDAVGLVTFDERIADYLPARYRPGHLHRLMLCLERATAGKSTDLSAPLEQVAATVRKRGMVVLISDLLDDPAQVLDGLKHFRYRGTDVIVFHILDPYELKFPFEYAARFRDMETEEEVMAVPGSIRDDYLRRIEGLIAFYKKELQLSGIDYCLLDTSQPLELGLMSYLMTRRRVL